jgi:hypothetical protein
MKVITNNKVTNFSFNIFICFCSHANTTGFAVSR